MGFLLALKKRSASFTGYPIGGLQLTHWKAQPLPPPPIPISAALGLFGSAFSALFSLNRMQQRRRQVLLA